MKVWGYLLSVTLLAGAFLAGRWTKPCTAPESVRRDTVILHDTLVVPVPTPERVEVIRRDTCWLVRCDTVLTADTLRVPVVVPIERRVYVTADYRAEVEGYRPRLVSMELYRQTQVVTETPAAGRNAGASASRRATAWRHAQAASSRTSASASNTVFGNGKRIENLSFGGGYEKSPRLLVVSHHILT